MISVIIPLSNYPFSGNLECIIGHLVSQDVQVEVLISDSSAEPSSDIKDLCGAFKECHYTYSKTDTSMINLGQCRNRAAKVAKGQFLYFTDADVVLYERQYLSKLHRLSEGHPRTTLVQPKMHRLLTNIEEFLGACSASRLISFKFNPAQCLYGFGDNRFLDIEEKRKLFEGRPYVCSEASYEPWESEDLRLKEELLWKPFLHWGGVFCEASFFYKVGGYCMKYFNWGCEDEDLIWKLRSLGSITYLYDEAPELAVLHLEHPRQYRTSLEINTRLLEKRMQEGIEAAIVSDVIEYKRL
ncbi:MAG: glycosyltransferase [Candidatus Thorarchaeota archaeon]|nr:glycosyltransferase [Candidatus Thorarchaeota archaeon]